MDATNTDKPGTRRGLGPRRPAWSMLLAVAGLVAMLAIALVAPNRPGLLRLDHSSVDVRTALLSHRTAKDHGRIAIVSITDDTLRPFAVQSPIDRGLLADIVQAADAAGAKAIGLDIYFIRATDPAKDQRLKDAIKNAKAEVILGALDERSEALPEQREYQRAFHAETGRKAGYLNLRFDRDGVVRYTASPADRTLFPESFAQLLARAVDPKLVQGGRRIAWLQKASGASLLNRLVILDGNSPFTEVPAHELLKPGNTAAADKLKGKVVLVGAERPYIDRHRTPLTASQGRELAGVQIHAQMLAEVLDHRRIRELDARQAQILLAAIAVCGMLAGWRYRSRRFDFLGWGIASVMLVAIDAVVFSQMHLSLPFLLTVAAWFAGVTAGHHSGHVSDWLTRRRSAA